MEKLESIWVCRFQVNHWWFQIEPDNLHLKPAMIDLELIQIRIGPRFSVIYVGFWQFLEGKKGIKWTTE